MAYFTKDANQSLAKPPLKLNGGLAKLGWTSVAKETPGRFQSSNRTFHSLYYNIIPHRQ